MITIFCWGYVVSGVLPAEQLPGLPVAPPAHDPWCLEAGVWLQDHLCRGSKRFQVLTGTSP